MNRQEELERLVLLRKSGEGGEALSEEDTLTVAGWTRDVDALELLSARGLQTGPSPQGRARILALAAECRHRRLRLRRVAWAGGIAASLALAAGSAWMALDSAREERRLSRLNDMLVLLEGGAVEAAPEGALRIEALADRLLDLQEGPRGAAEATAPEAEPASRPSTDSQSHSTRALPARIRG
jgi:hypothetical protein